MINKDDMHTKVGPLDGSLLDRVVREALDDTYLNVSTEPDLLAELCEASSRKDLRMVFDNEAPRAMSSYAVGDLVNELITKAGALTIREAVLRSAERLLRYREMELTVMQYLLTLPDAREASMKAAKIAQGCLVQDLCSVQAESDATAGTARYAAPTLHENLTAAGLFVQTIEPLLANRGLSLKEVSVSSVPRGLIPEESGFAPEYVFGIFRAEDGQPTPMAPIAVFALESRGGLAKAYSSKGIVVYSPDDRVRIDEFIRDLVWAAKWTQGV